MASAIPEEVTERLTCAICMEQFKEPKVLPCLHTYCKVCLVKLVKNKGSDHIITCPECRQDSNVPDGDAGRLQPNFWVNNFMTLLSMQDSASSTGNPLICEHCDSGDLAVSRCSNCSVFMCEFCVTAHKRINAFKSHQVLSLTEVKKLGSKALAKPVFCTKHEGETLKLFCNTCQKTICRDCTIVDHREHKYDFVTDVAEKEKEIIQSSLTKAKAKECTVVEGIKAVQVMKNGVQKRLSDVNKEIDAFFDEQVKALEYYRANIKHEVSTQVQIRVNKLETQAEVLSSFLAQLKSGISFTDQAFEDGDSVKLLAIKTQLIQQLGQLSSSQTQCKPCTDDYLEVQVHQTIWDIGKIVSVCYVSFDPQKCAVSMMGGEESVMYQTLAGQEVELLLLIKDENGHIKNKGGHQVEALLTFKANESGQSATSGVPVRDGGDGTYSIICHTVEDGQVTLSVIVEGQEVCGSPFQWNVNSKLPDGSSSPHRKASLATQPSLAIQASLASPPQKPQLATQVLPASLATQTSFATQTSLATQPLLATQPRKHPLATQTSLAFQARLTSPPQKPPLATQVLPASLASQTSFATQASLAAQPSLATQPLLATQPQQRPLAFQARLTSPPQKPPLATQVLPASLASQTSLATQLPLAAFIEGMHCWKLLLTSFSDVQNCKLVIGITPSCYGPNYGYASAAKWSWDYRTDRLPRCSRSDLKQASITSVENNDVFIVFLNLETKKLIIYNVRSKQTEIFTGVEGYVSPIVVCEIFELSQWGYDETMMSLKYPRLALQ